MRRQPLPPPLHDATPEAWLVHADLLQEHGASEADWLRSVRVAVGLRLTPRLVLVLRTVAPSGCSWPEAIGRGWSPRPLSWWSRVRCSWWMPRTAKRLPEFAGYDPFWSPAVPSDFPGLVEHRPLLAREFYRSVTRGVCVWVAGGVVWWRQYKKSGKYGYWVGEPERVW